MNNHELGYYIVLPASIFTVFVIGMYFLDQSMQNQWKEAVAKSEAKSQVENVTIHSMSCKQLGDWLVTDKWFDRDNLVWAQNHYLVSCK